jgi:hypothetical protein
MKLTDRQSASSASLTDLIHVVLTGDTSQNSAGSSYKIEMGDYTSLFPDKFVTGGTYSSGTAVFTNNSGGTFNVTGFKTSDLVVTGGTYNSGTATFTNNTGGTFSVSGFKTDDIFISGMTFNNGNYDLTINRNDGTNFTQSLSILSSDMTITGGTYNESTGIATFTNNSGGTFNVTGFLIQDNYQKIITTSYTLTNSDNNYTILINNGVNPITITVPSGLTAKFQVGFIQQGTGDVTFVGSGTTILTPIVGAFKIKGQNYNAYLEQVGITTVLHLLGNLKV